MVGGGGGIKCQVWEGGENWSKFCCLEDPVSTLALIWKVRCS